MRSLRDEMRKQAGWVWHEKVRADAHGLFLNEETITEILLLRLSKAAQHGQFSVKVFNKAEENQDGCGLGVSVSWATEPGQITCPGQAALSFGFVRVT